MANLEQFRRKIVLDKSLGTLEHVQCAQHMNVFIKHDIRLVLPGWLTQLDCCR